MRDYLTKHRGSAIPLGVITFKEISFPSSTFIIILSYIGLEELELFFRAFEI